MDKHNINMETLFTLLILVLGGFFLGWITIVLLPLIGNIGEIIAGKPEKRSRIRLSIGVWIGVLFQTYFYFSYMIYIISWVQTKVKPESWTKILIWMISFFVCVLPIFLGSANAKNHHLSKRTHYVSVIVESIKQTSYLSFIAFFVFVFLPETKIVLWSWVLKIGFPF